MRTKEVEEAINQLIVDKNFTLAGCSTGIININNVDTVLNYIEELETGEIEKTNLKIAELEYKIVELEKENYVQKIIINEQSISKETLRKIKTNTDTYRDFTEEVLKLL